jgi:ATP-dependent DNA helicase RecG
VLTEPAVRFFRKSGTVKITCEQEGYYFSIIWFNQPYVANKLVVGQEYLFYGRVRCDGGVVSLVNPSFELCEKSFRLKGIVPQYGLKGNLTQKIMRDSIRLAVDVEKPKSIIPSELQRKYALTDLYSAYREVHNPTAFESQRKSANRIAVEEYFSLISAFRFIKGGREQVRINKYDVTSKQLVEFITTRFPFEFTDGQKNAVNEIFADMSGPTVMNRLLQGDVGSGKTIVALLTALLAVDNGYQACIMAPTEILANQHYETICNLFRRK